MLCAWIIFYLTINGLYPWQVNLLSDVLLQQVYKVVELVLASRG